jgi:L-alanine-DL-glutamate epimerase-like enolase superfamily enzyme
VRIARIDVFEVRYHHAGGPFAISGGRVSTEQDGTVVRVETDDGLVGWGEQCVFTPSFLPGYGPSTRAVLALLAPAVLGADPRQVEVVYARMDAAVKGYSYAKSALDIACWDLLGKATGLRVSDLLGGTQQQEFPLYTGIGIAPPDEMRKKCVGATAAGYRQIQLKAGTHWREDVERVEACLEALAGAERVIVDANGYWPQADAVAFVAAVDAHNVSVEQPCATIEECARVRRGTRRPFVLDESLTQAVDVVRAHASGAVDAVRLKLSQFGGITPTRRARDLATALGLAMTIEDSGGGDVVTAAAAHLTCSVPPRLLLAGYLPSEMVAECIASGTPVAAAGQARLPAGAGLGIEVDESRLGEPVLRVEP